MSTIKLLLVDDEERFLSTTRLLLENRGLDVLTATNGLDALKILGEKRVDVVVLDVKMPGMDGVTALQQIKKSFPLVEVILLTGHATVDSAVAGLKLGAFDYVMKPCDIPVIVEKAKEAALRKQARQDRIAQSRVDEIISHPMAVFDKDPEDR